MRESQIQNAIIQRLKKNYPRAYIVKISDRFVSGIPDILMILRGVPYFFEVKTPMGKLTNLQMYTLKKIQRAGGKVAVLRSVLDIKYKGGIT